jgi:hypothetical protein
MFSCERCGSRFSPIRAPLDETGPRCRARDGISVPLSFTPFSAATFEDEAATPEPAEDPHDEGPSSPRG